MKATKFVRSLFTLSVCLAMLLSLVPLQSALAVSPNIVISQVYGGGGNSGALYKNDFIELYNLGAEAVNVTDWSVQYASPAGSTWQVTTLAGTIQPGKYYLIKEAAGAGGTLELPTPDAVGTIAMGAANGKIALVNNSTALVGTCPGGVVDFVGYGTANCSETAPTPALSNTTAALRKANGAQDTDNNFNDFDIGAPQPRNSLYPFGAVGLATPSSLLPGETTLLTVTVTPGTNPPSTGITVNGDLSLIGGANPQIFYDDGTHGDVTVGDNVFSFSSVVSFATSPGGKSLPITVSDLEGRTITTTITLTIASNVITPIADARTAGVGWTGTIQGNVTVVPGKFHARSFAIQDNTGGLYIFPSTTPPSMALGDVVMVQGTIAVYHGLLELTSITNVAVIGPGTPPDPLITPTGSVAPTQGKLIQIQGLVSSITGTGNKTVKINDGSGETTVFIYSLTGIVTSAISPGVEMRAIGMSGAYDGPQVNPRYQSDIFIFPPAVTATYPQDEATDVSLYRPLTATFNHMMDPTTISTDTFTLAESNETISGTVTYDGDSKTASFTPTSILSELTEYTATLTTDIKDVHNIALTSDYTWTFTTGTEDITPPTIIATDPYAGEIDVPLSSSVVITFSEDLKPSSLIPDNFILENVYGEVPKTLTYNPNTFAVTLDPSIRLLPTMSYTVTVSGVVEDWAGLPLGDNAEWTFETMVEPPMQVYFGDLHNHTGISDGSGTPDQALAAGEAAGFDFMAISDHSYAINDTEWADTLSAVETATDSGFVALRGFEYTQGAEGHINVYNTVRHATRTNVAGCTYCDYTPNLEPGATVEGFYQWAASEGLIGLDTAGTVLQFNHPGWINFNDWTYHPEVSDIAKLEEVGNGNGTSYAFSEDQFIRSLDYGWKVGATNNADTHTTGWGTNTDHRTGVVMDELTKNALLEALHARRTFATEDKNFSLSMKANGAWMGSEIPNSGHIQFEIIGEDEGGELASVVQIIADQGAVVAEYTPLTASFTWSPQLDITTGVHYYYVRVTQEDDDLIVSSPVWTMGAEDISITDVIIQPSLPTIYSPSLLTVRVTNRVDETRPVTVTLDVNGVPLTPTIGITVPGNGDAFTNFSWQPEITGEVTVTAQIVGVPEGDNPDDNLSALNLIVTDEQLPLILIDAGHGNLNATGFEMAAFINDLSDHSYNVLKNLDELTTDDLNPGIVKLLLITAPEDAYTLDELAAISGYIAAGGNLWLVGISDYPPGSWASTAADRENAILAAIETATGANINMRINDDEIIDGDDNNGYVFGPLWGDFPSQGTTSIGINVVKIASWSVASLRGREVGTPLTADTPNVQIVVQGDLDDGYMNNPPWYDPYHTSNEDADNAGDAYIYNPGWVYPAPVPPDALPVPMAAVTDLPGEGGRIMVYGDSNDAFTTYAYTAGDGKQNELFNLEAVMWLIGEPLQKSTIAEARAQSELNQPDNLDKLVWVEGEITAAYGEFFNVLYVQDETGGITVHAPAGDIDPSQYTRGTIVRVVGTVGIYNGDTEIEFFEAEMVQVIGPGTGEPEPLPMSTLDASLEVSQGWLAVITGTVTTKIGEDTIFVDDGSGPVRVFLDGYNGNFSDIQLNDWVQVTSLVSEDGEGQRIRVRNHGMHPEYADDVIDLPHVLIQKSVAAQELLNLGDEITYTLQVSNTGVTSALDVLLTDSLPEGITFGGWVEQNGAEESNGVITWDGDLPESTEIVFTATVDMDSNLYGEIITNTVEVSSTNAGSGSASAAITVGMPELSLTKTVEAGQLPVQPGDPVTYTLVVRNDSAFDAVGVHIWDELPEGVVGDGVDITVTIGAGTAYTITLPAVLAQNMERGSMIINTAYFESGKLSGDDSVSVAVGDFFKLYLPINMKH